MKKFENEYMERNYFDWDKARAFYYVAKIGSITLASKRIHTSQPALSRKISGLEAELNCILLTRSRDGVTLTRRGEEFFKAVEQTFYTMREFHYSDPNKYNNGQKRRIRISTTQPIAAYMLNEHILNYNKIHPEIIFEIDTNDYVIDLIVNDVDIAIRPYDEDAKNVQQEHLFTLQKQLYASQKYIDQYGEPETVEDLEHHRLLAYSHAEERPYADLKWILKLGKSNGDLHTPIYTADSLECLIEATKKGMGIFACYEDMTIIKNSGLVRILQNIKSFEIKEYLIFPNYLENDAIFLDFKNYLLDKFSYSRENL